MESEYVPLVNESIISLTTCTYECLNGSYTLSLWFIKCTTGVVIKEGKGLGEWAFFFL